MKDRGSNPRWRVFFDFLIFFYHIYSLYLWSLLFYDLLLFRGCSSYGRAFALHARGTGIDTPHLHLFFIFYTIQLYCYDSFFFMCVMCLSLVYFRFGDVAQMVEHSLSMRGARGSIPRISIIKFFLFFKNALTFMCFFFP